MKKDESKKPNSKIATVGYTSILLHSTNISIQEYQKKMKIYQRMVYNKKIMELVEQPEM